MMVANAGPHLMGQLAAEWATGARVSSIIHGCRFCDLELAAGSERLTFHKTKTGKRVDAVLRGRAVELLRAYVAWRGTPLDLEEPLFLTHRRVSYSDNGKEYGGQNKAAFNAMKRRTIAEIRRTAAAEIRNLRRRGDRTAAKVRLGQAKAAADLVRQVTQHWFRHALATTWFAAGADIRSVMDQGSWLTHETVLSYTHGIEARRREIAGRVAAGKEKTEKD